MASIFSADKYSSLVGLDTDKIDQIIIRDESTQKFMRMPVGHLLEQFQEGLHLHEVIPPKRIQRIRFDIDAKTTESVMPLVEAIIAEIDLLTDELSASQNFVGPSECLITSASSAEKQSYHILTPIYCETCFVAKRYSDIILEKLSDHPMINYVDANVSKPNQNFRLLGCSKVDSPNRIKRSITENDSLFDHLVGWYGGGKPLMIYDSHCQNYAVNAVSEANPEVFDILKTIPDFEKDWSFRNCSGPWYSFNRLRPSFCMICQDTHHKDNTLIVKVNKGVYIGCRHKKGMQKIGDFPIHIPATPTMDGTPNIDLTPYYDAPTLMVKAAMKMGKTKAIIKLLADLKPKSVIFISFRQTFSHAIMENLGETFESYMDIQGHITLEEHPYLVIQVDSLQRVSGEPDMVILDECESILSQFSSSQIRNPDWVFAKFHYLVRRAQKLICMDAHLSLRSERLMEKWRGELTYYVNQYQNAKNDKFYIVQNTAALVQVALDKLNAGKKIVICSNSLEEAKLIDYSICQKIPLERLQKEPPKGRAIVNYSSESSPALKRLHFSNVNHWWKMVDVLIYTPTVSAGISFEIEHFDCVLCHFTNMSCDAETAIQMIGRVRNVRDHEYYVSFSNVPCFYPYDPAVLRKLVMSNFIECHKYGSESLPPGSPCYTDEGKLIYQNNAFFDLWIENLAFKNYSRNYFPEHFMNLCVKTGATFHHSDAIGSDLPRKACKESNADLVADAKDIPDEQFNAIIDALQSNAPIEIEQSDILSVRKKALAKTYNVSKIDREFVLYFDKDEYRRAYRNLIRIKDFLIGKETSAHVIQRIYNDEIDKRTRHININTSTLDITINHDFLQHYYALLILEELGFAKWSNRVEDATFPGILEALSQKIKTEEIGVLYGIGKVNFLTLVRGIIKFQYRLSLRKEHKKWQIKPDLKLMELVMRE